jgi:hypothetical protein
MWEWLNRLPGTEKAAPHLARGSTLALGGRPSPAALSAVSTGFPSYPAHLALLAKFRHPSDPAAVGKNYWNAVLTEPVGATLAQFRSNGWLVDAPWQEVFTARHRIDDLKGLLRDRGLRVSGKKAELAARLIKTDAEGMRHRIADMEAWVLSQTVAAHVEQQLLAEKAVEARAHDAAFSALREGQVSKAVDAIVAYERTRLFPRGLGIDWHRDGIGEPLIEEAQAILQASPGILSDMPEHELDVLRPVAAILQLTGESRSRPWLPTGIVGHSRLDIETAVRMMLFHGSNTVRLQGLRKAGYKQVDVVTCGSASCPTCQALEGNTFAISLVPELPHPGCTHELGCRCLYQAHLDF